MSRFALPALTVIALCAIAATTPLPQDNSPAGVDYTIGNTNPSAKPIAPFVRTGIEWLAEAQLPNGGWGAGMHTRQDIRDPHEVQMDPATTAFAAMALLRSGNTVSKGPYAAHVSKALDALLDIIDQAPPGSNITSITGTQPQRKLGQNIDVAMASQFLTKIRPTLADEKQRKRVDKAIAICVEKLEQGQNNDGSYAQGGWAPVLQSAMATNALEQAGATGYRVDKKKLESAKSYQRTNVDATSGAVMGGDAAGVSLYALASTQRASVKEASRVREILGDVSSIDLGEINGKDLERELKGNGVNDEEAKVLSEAFVVNRMANVQLRDDKILKGFGNNGGEEFLSFMMTSEALASTASDDWDVWHAKMSNTLSSVQNPNGSWSGHHCITSPVFCTAAVILAMTADQDLKQAAPSK
jgi:hypothetical protein